MHLSRTCCSEGLGASFAFAKQADAGQKGFQWEKMGRLRCVLLEAVDVEEAVADLTGTRMSSVTHEGCVSGLLWLVLNQGSYELLIK